MAWLRGHWLGVAVQEGMPVVLETTVGVTLTASLSLHELRDRVQLQELGDTQDESTQLACPWPSIYLRHPKSNQTLQTTKPFQMGNNKNVQ